jgi:hypothetical protein
LGWTETGVRDPLGEAMSWLAAAAKNLYRSMGGGRNKPEEQH